MVRAAVRGKRGARITMHTHRSVFLLFLLQVHIDSGWLRAQVNRYHPFHYIHHTGQFTSLSYIDSFTVFPFGLFYLLNIFQKFPQFPSTYHWRMTLANAAFNISASAILGRIYSRPTEQRRAKA